MIKRVYIDTSVFGGYFDKEFSDNTVPVFERVKSDAEAIALADQYIY